MFLTTSPVNSICVGFNQIFQGWFPQDGTGSNISNIIVEEYANSKIGLYFLVLMSIQIFGIIINVIPFVCNWVEQLRMEASDAESAIFSSVDDKDSVMTSDTAGIVETMRRESSLSDIESNLIPNMY
jgi:hypothetical protein